MKIVSFLRHRHAVFLFRIGVGGFFLVAAVAKLAQPTDFFANQIKSFGVVPEGWAYGLALLLPWLELLSGWFLVAGFLAKWATSLISAQLAAFTAVLAVSIYFGTAPEDCGCLPGVSETPGQALVRDVVMLVWTGVIFRSLPGSYSLDARLGLES